MTDAASRERSAVASPGLTAPRVAHSPVVLLLVDFVNPLRFPGADALKGPALEAARATARLVRRTRNKLQIIYANDNFGFWQSDFKEVWQQCAQAGPEARSLARTLKPRAGDYTVLKPRHSAFYATPLEIILQQLRCRKLIVTGLAADNCVLFTCMDAYLRGFRLWVPEDCVASETEDAKREALNQIRRVLKAQTRRATLA